MNKKTNVNDLEFMQDLNEEPKEEELETRDYLIKEYDEIDNRLKHLRVMEDEGKEKLREALDFLNGIQKNLERADEELEANNYKLQFKKYVKVQ